MTPPWLKTLYKEMLAVSAWIKRIKLGENAEHCHVQERKWRLCVTCTIPCIMGHKRWLQPGEKMYICIVHCALCIVHCALCIVRGQERRWGWRQWREEWWRSDAYRSPLKIQYKYNGNTYTSHMKSTRPGLKIHYKYMVHSTYIECNKENVHN